MNIAQLIGWGIALVVFLGAAVVYLRGSKDTGTIRTLEKNNEALTSRVGILEAGELVSKAKIEAAETRLSALEEENRVLREHRPSAEAIEAMAADLVKLHKALILHDKSPGSLVKP